ncbi:CHAT domain-containing protein [Robiginitalea sp. IMCC44478]|uniref:CHAT domain-containing protein n=1 Tax=Robiginitalea sp. IMCC44478 TaxID=3459122 RepID=UPI0040425772
MYTTLCLRSLLIFLFLSFVLQAQQPPEAMIETYIDKGYMSMERSKDSAYSYFNKALELAKQTGNSTAQLDTYLWLQYANSMFYDLLEYEKNLSAYKSILDSRADSIQAFEEYLEQYLYNSGRYFYNSKRYGKAKEFFNELEKQLQGQATTTTDSYQATFYVNVLSYLGSIYRHAGKYELAEYEYQKGISFAREHDEIVPGHRIPTIEQLLAALYSEQNNTTRADALLRKALKSYQDFYRDSDRFRNNVINIQLKLGRNGLRQKNTQMALEWAEKTSRYLSGEDPFHKDVLLLKADALMAAGSHREASLIYEEVLNLTRDIYNSRKHQDIASIYIKMADNSMAAGTHETALEYLQLAMSQLDDDPTDDLVIANPDQLLSKKVYMNLLHSHLSYLESDRQNGATSTSHITLFETIDALLRTFDSLRKEFESKLDKSFLLEEVYPIFTKMMGLCHSAFLTDGDKQRFFELALRVSESYKDIFFLDALRTANASDFDGVPRSVTNRETAFRYRINELEKEWFTEGQNHQNAELRDSIYALKEAYDRYLDSISVAYPKYYNLKYKPFKVSLYALRQKMTGNNQMLISYTVAGNYLYLQWVNSKGFDFLKIPYGRDETELISSFYRAMERPQLNQLDKLEKMGKELYNLVLANVPLKKEEHLLIVPDGALFYLPFEALRDQRGSYLLESCTISYSNSINGLFEIAKRDSLDNLKLLAVAPEFSQEGAGLAPLKYNGEEVRLISEYFDSQSLTGEEGTLTRFLEQVKNHKLIHLATHASANDAFPDYSNLAFYGDNKNLLYVKDLYNLELNATMVTLSACQTGIGQLRKGEGMLSLSKGFFYAGARSLINSLWKINDKSTSRLMSYFYENLSKGKPKDVALREAKLKYLRTTEDPYLRHPYYWASFVISGNTDALLQDWKLLYWVSGLLLLAGFAFWRYNRRKEQAA